MRLLLTLLAVAALVPAAAAARTGAMPSPCRGGELRGSFSLVPHSRGAGQVRYRLRLVNRSNAECSVTGIPGLRLLGRTGRPLPTHVRPAHPGALTAVLVRLRPGQAAHTVAAFSPDVTGVGDHHPGPCQPRSYWLRVTPAAGGGLRAPVTPPTAVCERGELRLDALSPGR